MTKWGLRNLYFSHSIIVMAITYVNKDGMGREMERYKMQAYNIQSEVSREECIGRPKIKNGGKCQNLHTLPDGRNSTFREIRLKSIFCSS